MFLFGFWALLALILYSGVTEELFEVSVWPDQALVEFGRSLVVNCSTSCPDPGPSGIETILKKTQLGRGPQWKEFLLENITENSTLQCFFSCAGIQRARSLGISVYQPPALVSLELQPEWVAVDEDVTVKCHVPSVTPLEELTLTLLQGNQELYQKHFSSLTTAAPKAEVTVTFRAHREDDRCHFSCHAQLNLSSQGGGLFHTSSAVSVLRIFEFSQNPQIWVFPLLEVGVAESVSCEVDKVFPAKAVTFSVFLGDQELSPFLSWEGDTAWANATVRAMETGDQELSCLVYLGPKEQKTSKLVYVYSFPPPILEINESYPLVGTGVKVTCSGHVLTSPSPTLRLQGAPYLPAPGEPAWISLTAREEDDGRNFSCEASVVVQDYRLIKTADTQLHVFYEPRFEESGCPGNQTWVEGTEQMIACVPKGNPTPRLVCTWNGMIFDLDFPQKAMQNHAGTYCCKATNQLGSASKDIAVVVLQGDADAFSSVLGLAEDFNPTVCIIIIIIISCSIALGVGFAIIALHSSYWPCKVETRKLAYRPKQDNQEEENQVAVEQAEKC
ncbi:intercellular adhesion molecule 5 [Echinops telfairi]|uniref:Intercellular adhesion molecule 5 n=1 Tax=Echinops telfairi TaxID=9371 RepID=A0AC55DVW1_ECHTE|nr:intercellular adhesion molecule 5 [Echinops telfairi]